ncbi:MAG: response regulator [Candidatus Eremiobacteraeota bacterium]|nr:response regulator [Candidatus Eremiobacteraeota bacterium]
MKRILVIDDDELFLATIERVLKKQDFHVRTAASGAEALELVKGESFDLVISDVRMPGMDGLQTLKEIRARDSRSRAIVVTGFASDSAPIEAIKLGADDYLKKPFQMEEFIDSIRRSLERCGTSVGKGESVAELQRHYHELLENLILAVEKDHAHFHDHAKDVAAMAMKIGREMGFPQEKLDLLRIAAILHDVGMFGIKEAVLEKADYLEESEQAMIKETPHIARTMLKDVEGLRPLLPMIYHLHERFDGSGYPEGIEGEEIPLESRILAVAEAYISLVSPRPHREKKSAGDALEIIVKESGTRYDPSVVDAFKRAVGEEKESTGAGDAEEKSLRNILMLAQHYSRSGDFVLAGSALAKLFELSGSSAPGRIHLMVEAELLRARILTHGGNLQGALESAQEALKSAKKIGEHLLTAHAFMILGTIWSRLGKSGEAGLALGKAREIFEKWGDELELSRVMLEQLLLLRKMPDGGFRSALEDTLSQVYSAGAGTLLIDEGLEFLPLVVSAVEWNIEGEQTGRIVGLLIRHYPLETIRAFAEGSPAAQEYIISFLQELGGKRGKEGLSLLLDSQDGGVRKKASEAFSTISSLEKPLLKIQCLGHFALFLDGRPVDEALWQTKYARLLFIYLVLAGGKPVTEDRLMDLFWQESPPDKAKQNLLTTLTRIRNVFRKHYHDMDIQEYVVKSGELIRFNTDAHYWLDVEEFEGCIAEAAGYEASGNRKKAVIACQKAQNLYSGALLEGIYEDWCLTRREELQEHYLSALAKISEYHLERGNDEGALKYARLMLETDQFSGQGLVSYLKASCRAGRRDAAAKKYHEYSRKIEKELGIPPDPEVMKIYYQLIDGAT